MSDRVTTLATCWLMTLADTTTLGFTDHDTDLTVSAQLYKSAIGYIPSAIQNTTELAPDNMDVVGIIDDDGIKQADLRAGKYDNARILIFTVDYTDVGSGPVQTVINGKLGAVSLEQNQFTAELNNLASMLQSNVGEAGTPLCSADLADSRCAPNSEVVLTPASVSVTSVVDNITFADSARTEADDYFNGGLFVWLTGLNAGYEMDIKDYVQTGGVFTLYEPMPFTISATDTGTATIGCDKTIATCKNEFNNIVNFRGLPHLPGTQKLIG